MSHPQRDASEISSDMRGRILDTNGLGNQNGQIAQNNSENNLDEGIKKLDYATMIFSLVYIISFASLYWIILYGLKDEFIP